MLSCPKVTWFWTKATITLLCFIFILYPQRGFAQNIDVEAARDQILDGVSKLANPTQPGHMVVFGDNAYSIANYKDQDRRNPMLAAAGWGAGRVLAVGDHQWLQMNSYGDVDDTGALYLNSIAWLADTTDKTIKIVVTSNTSAKTWLEAQGFTNVVQSGNYAVELADAEVLVGWLGSSVAQADLDTIATFVQNGGGLFLADYGIGYDWWWAPDLPEAPGNKLLRAVGIGFSNDWPNGTLELTRASGQTTAQDVLEMLDDPSPFTAAELDIGGAVMTRMYQVLPSGDPLLAQMDLAYVQRIDQINPTPLTPVSDNFEKALLTREGQLLSATAPQDVTVHRLAETIYGSVPATATRASHTFSLDTTQSRWQPTGLFAAPGEIVTVTVPAALVGQGSWVRINAHSDNISPRDRWERPPVVHRSFEIGQAATTAANGFGGLIFIDLGSTPPNVGNVEIQIENAVEAPYFDLDKHTDAEWSSTLRARPAPFGVLVSEKMIIALPKRHIESANLTEPTALMTWWNQVVFLQDDLADQTQFRTSPELANVDVQSSHGAAHAGYPYQAYEKHWGNMANWDHLRTQGTWGDYHELGHNHQRDWWTFDGDTEVTVNVFSNHSMETLTPESTGGWSWSVDPVQVINRAIDDVSPGGTYASKPNRWSFWFQLADGFGWETYRRLFRGYEADKASNPSALPTTDAQEKDQWLVRFSNEVGYDMHCFMVDTWGLQVSQSALDAVSHLPCWMPLIGGNLDATIPVGGSHQFDIAGNALSMDGVANVVAVGSPVNGAIVDNGNGSWTYTPNANFHGQEVINYVLQSSVGNTQTFSITIDVEAADGDGDTIPDHVEEGAPNNGDGNGDGLPDKDQSAVVSLLDRSGLSYITAEVAGDCAEITHIRHIVESDVATADASYSYPVGLMEISLACPNVGDSATVAYYWHNATDLTGLPFRKYGPSTPGGTVRSFYDFDVAYAQVTIGTTTVPRSEITLTDGAHGDDSGSDGHIVDPGGPASASQKSTLGDFVWYDVNGDGVKDSGEVGINGVLVELYEVTSSNGTTTTNYLTSMLTGPDSPSLDSDDTLAGEAGAYDFAIEGNKLYQVVISSTNFLPGGVLEKYTYTGENAGNGYNGPNPRLVPIVGTQVDYNHADFPFWLPPGIEIDKKRNGTNPFGVGDTISFTIRVTNTGSLTITALPLEDLYNAAFLDYQSASIPPDNPASNGELQWANLTPLGGLAPNQFIDITLFFTALADTTLLPGTASCPQNGHTVNVARVANAVADLDGPGPIPSVSVPSQEDCDSVQILGPTAVALTGLAATRTESGILVEWTTIYEANILGFRLLRVSASGGEAVEVVPPDGVAGSLMPAEHSGQSAGATYRLMDTDPAAREGITYILEIVTPDGSTERVEVAVEGSLPPNGSGKSSIYLPLLRR